jgi:hypothetical protein
MFSATVSQESVSLKGTHYLWVTDSVCGESAKFKMKVLGVGISEDLFPPMD